MYLAGILGLCALLHLPGWGGVSSDASLFAFRSEAGIPRQISDQQPAKPGQASQPTTPQEQSQPEASQPPNSETKPQDSIQTQAPPVTPGTVPKEPTKQQKSTQQRSNSKKRPHKNPHTTATTGQTGQEAQKRVVHRGSTAEPNAQLTPSITEEQAARQRQNTNDLLASTDASLQKLSGRQLSQDEQETVGQIRKFMQQVKEADKEGDLQRAYKLAVKAHLLSDALAKP